MELQNQDLEKYQHASRLSREVLTGYMIDLVSKPVKVQEFPPTQKLVILPEKELVAQSLMELMSVLPAAK